MTEGKAVDHACLHDEMLISIAISLASLVEVGDETAELVIHTPLPEWQYLFDQDAAKVQDVLIHRDSLVISGSDSAAISPPRVSSARQRWGVAAGKIIHQ